MLDRINWRATWSVDLRQGWKVYSSSDGKRVKGCGKWGKVGRCDEGGLWSKSLGGREQTLSVGRKAWYF